MTFDDMTEFSEKRLKLFEINILYEILVAYVLANFWLVYK